MYLRRDTDCDLFTRKPQTDVTATVLMRRVLSSESDSDLGYKVRAGAHLTRTLPSPMEAHRI